MGRDSCGHLCRKSQHSQCRYTRQCSNWCWDRQMPEIQWPSWQLLLSTSYNRNHWCVWQFHCPLLELSRKETCWYFRRPQRRTVAPLAPVSGHGQREHRSTQPPVVPAASRLQYGRRRNANTLPEHGHIERIEPILAIISVEMLLIFQPKWVFYMSKNIFCLIKTCALISNSLFHSVKLSTLYSALNLQC